MYLEINLSSRGQFYFVVKSNGNHHVLATSEMYNRKADAVHGAQIIATSGQAEVFDNTTS